MKGYQFITSYNGYYKQKTYYIYKQNKYNPYTSRTERMFLK